MAVGFHRISVTHQPVFDAQCREDAIAADRVPVTRLGHRRGAVAIRVTTLAVVAQAGKDNRFGSCANGQQLTIALYIKARILCKFHQTPGSIVNTTPSAT